MSGNPGDVFHVKGLADENHSHRDLSRRIDALRDEWNEFIAALEGGEYVVQGLAPEDAPRRDGGDR